MMRSKQIADILYEFHASADITLEDLAELISEEIPSVVRCKDCKYGEKEDRLYYCNYTGETWNYGNFYCAGGERKDDE